MNNQNNSNMNNTSSMGSTNNWSSGNSQQATQFIGEKEILNDCIISQKLISASYNTYADECVNQQLRTEFLNILNEEHGIQASIFNNMQSKGWYKVEQADQNKVQQAKQKFTSSMQ